MSSSLFAANAVDAQGRRSELLGLIRAQGKLDVSGINTLLGISPETLRRDLRALESQGLIRRGYGIAYPVDSGAFESALDVRESINPEEKSRIANAVIPHIGESRTLYIDEGFQTQLIAQRLPLDLPLTVVTPSLPIAALLAARPNVSVVILGGRVRGSTLGVVDSWAADMLSRLTIDLAIIGANGVSVERGMTTPDPAVAAVKAAAVKASTRRMFIAAHHKFGRATFVKFADIEDFEILITGHELPASQANRFAATGVPVQRV